MAEDKYFPYIATVYRVVLGVLFLYASLDKIANPDLFARVIHNYRLVPTLLINPMAITMPWVEFLAGAFLILGVLPRGSVLVINALLVVFIVALGINVLRGVDVQCGCFTVAPSAKEEGLELIWRDILFLLLGVFVQVSRGGAFCLYRK